MLDFKAGWTSAVKFAITNKSNSIHIFGVPLEMLELISSLALNLIIQCTIAIKLLTSLIFF